MTMAQNNVHQDLDGPKSKKDSEEGYYYALYKDLAEAESKSVKSPTKTKRERFLSWDNYFMALAYLSAQRSPDPNTQALDDDSHSENFPSVGACIVDPENRIVGMGHNAMPVGLDQEMPWNRFAENEFFEKTKHPYVCHAAVNAILSSCAVSLKGCTIYCTLFPGHEDTKLIIQSGISRVVYFDDKYYGRKFSEISRKMLIKAGVSTSQKWWDKKQYDIRPKAKFRVSIIDSEGSAPEGSTQGADESKESAPEGSTQGADESKESAPEGSTQGADESKESAPEGSTQGADESKKVGPRAWDDVLQDEAYFMAVALVSAERSKDPSRQVGACIVNKSGNIVGVGYNRFPKGFGDDDVDVTWHKMDDGRCDPAITKHPFVCHAEANAIVHKSCIDLEGCTIYTTYFPCNECAKLILQSKIKEVVYLEGQKSAKDKLYLKTSRKLLDAAEEKKLIKLKQFSDEIGIIKLKLPMMQSPSSAKKQLF